MCFQSHARQPIESIIIIIYCTTDVSGVRFVSPTADSPTNQ